VVANPKVREIPSHERKQFEELGEAYVRQAYSGGLWPSSSSGYPHPTTVNALAWLAEIGEEGRKRTDAIQTEQTRLNKSTLRAAWIAAGAAIVGILVMVGLSYAQYRIAKAEVAHNRMIEDGIGRYIKSGDAIMNGFAQNKWPS
jgi:hypothetical protein